MTLSKAILPEFEREMAGLRRVLERVPSDRLDYRPHPKSFSLGELANHLASMPGWVVSTMTLTELDFSLPETRERIPKPSTTADGIVRTLDQCVEAALETLSKASNPDFQVVWSLKNEGEVLFSLPRLEVLRTFVMNHMIHHRAQLTVYFRMLDVPLPALYGPSADEA